MKKLYVFNPSFSKTCQKILQTKYDLTIRKEQTVATEEEVTNLVREYDGFIIGISIKMTKRVLEAIGNKAFAVATTSVGLDHFAPEFFKAENVKVISCHNANYLSVAEHTIAVILALYKKLKLSDKLMFGHKDREGLNGLPHDLSGQTIGLIGSGRIARKVIDFAKVFEMKILCNSVVEDEDLKNVVEFCSLEKLLKESDIVSLHAPLTPQTKNLLNAENMKLMKPSAFVVNTARLPMIDNKALADLLTAGKLAGASLDIDGFEFAEIDLFKGMDNVILTPHIAGVTVEAWDRMQQEITDELMELS